MDPTYTQVALEVASDALLIFFVAFGGWSALKFTWRIFNNV